MEIDEFCALVYAHKGDSSWTCRELFEDVRTGRIRGRHQRLWANSNVTSLGRWLGHNKERGEYWFLERTSNRRMANRWRVVSRLL